jgi:hypothetical protein
MATKSVSTNTPASPGNARGVPIGKLNIESLLDALFPQTVRAGKVDVGEIVRQCQYRAEAILERADVEGAGGKSTAADAIDAARGYVAAANSLIDLVVDGRAT